MASLKVYISEEKETLWYIVLRMNFISDILIDAQQTRPVITVYSTLTVPPTETPARPTTYSTPTTRPQDETSKVGIICAAAFGVFILIIISVFTVRCILRQRRHDLGYGMNSAKVEVSGLPEDDNPTGHGDPRRKSRAGQNSNLINDKAMGSGVGQSYNQMQPPPIYPSPIYPNPIYPSPIYPGPIHPGPIHPGPIHPSQIYNPMQPQYNEPYNEDNNILRIASDEGGRTDGSKNYGPSEEDVLRVPSERESMNEAMRLAQEASKMKSKEENSRESQQVVTFPGNTEINTNLKDIT
ncbi:9642_t:CDS:2 [Cetraspora pellucida]|uniref:9642_t:CDS:1 n=1 Tax=Cetraspora pellucida TaxID=1433469 RepID=A0ACA9LM47_9GLOM|nr:9642_t:CDS:2 [Cetraspora pellucida]